MEFFPYQPITALNTAKYSFNRVEQFKYLGTIVTEHNEMAREVSPRIQIRNKCYYGLSMIL